jgi:hypothetical protein
MNYDVLSSFFVVTVDFTHDEGQFVHLHLHEVLTPRTLDGDRDLVDLLFAQLVGYIHCCTNKL